MYLNTDTEMRIKNLKIVTIRERLEECHLGNTFKHALFLLQIVPFFNFECSIFNFSEGRTVAHAAREKKKKEYNEVYIFLCISVFLLVCACLCLCVVNQRTRGRYFVF